MAHRSALRAAIVVAVALLAGACTADPSPRSGDELPAAESRGADSVVADLIADAAGAGPVTVTVTHSSELDGVGSRSTSTLVVDGEQNTSLTVTEHVGVDDVVVSRTVSDGTSTWWQQPDGAWAGLGESAAPTLRTATWFDLAEIAAGGTYDDGSVTFDGGVVDSDGYMHDIDLFDVVVGDDGRLERIVYEAALADSAGAADFGTWRIEVVVVRGPVDAVELPVDVADTPAWDSSAAAAQNVRASLLWAVSGTDMDPATTALVVDATSAIPANVTVEFTDRPDGIVASRHVSFDDGTAVLCLTIGDSAGEGWSVTDGRCSS